MWSVMYLRCICSASVVRLRIVVFEDIVEDVVVCGTPAAPLLQAYGIMVVCSAIAVDRLQ